MKKRMFSKFTNYFHQAVEAFSTQVSLQEEFVHHWKSVTTYFMENKGDKVPIDQTHIPFHLDQMLALLQEEEKGIDGETTGPCCEYLLQHKLLETLYSLGRSDHPPGMKQVVLTFFTKLLSRLKQPLLPHVSVHRAAHRLVKICGDVKAAPSESEEIQYLCTICAKIKANPYLVNFFIDIYQNPNTSETASAKSSKPGTARPVAKATSKVPVESEGSQEGLKQEFSLMDSLMTLSKSADSRVAVKACEGFMLIVSLPELSSANCIVKYTTFCEEMAQRLVESYLRLPELVNPSDLDNVQAKWGLDVITESEDQQTFLGKRHLVSFLSWLDYCDQLIGMAHPMIGQTLAQSVRNLFLDVIMEPSLLQTSESGAILATAYLNRCLRTVSSPALLNEFVTFMLGESSSPESPKETPECVIRERLIQRCNHLSEELCLVTLKLFDSLLMKDNRFIMENLVLRNLTGRSYYKISSDKLPKDNNKASTTTQNHSENVDSTESVPDDSGFSDHLANLEGLSPNSSPIKEKTEVHRIVNGFLTLLPEELKSSHRTIDGGFDMYLKEAHRQFKDVCTMCQKWDWPKEPISGNIEQEEFYEGFFLKVVLEKLASMLDQSYSVNLQLTSVISKLACIPHPNLNEFLLEPFLPTRNGIKTLFSVLKKVANEISAKMACDHELAKKLVAVRKQLMGFSSGLRRMEGQNQMEAIIVFEEFCKELSAIAFVKHHTAVLQS